MSFKLFPATLLIFCLLPYVAFCADEEPVNLGGWSTTELAQIITSARRIDAPGERIVALSRHFLDTPYVANTLIGGPQTAEQLVVNLAGFDCFTFLDVVEALRRTAGVADFPGQLQQVRYHGGKLAYKNRRHFFSDWAAGEAARVADVTEAVGQGSAQVVVKQLNLKSNGTYWLPGISVTRREMSYIPTDKIARGMLSALQDGDYVGIYSAHDGLDVSHTGLIVKGKDSVRLRHASSRDRLRRVVDEDLLNYLQGKPGLVVYRVK